MPAPGGRSDHTQGWRRGRGCKTRMVCCPHFLWHLAVVVWLAQVILDVVFNHTAEGNEKGPTLSFRGLDNRVYYMLAPLGEYYNYR